MKNIVSFILILAFSSNIALADCDFSTGISRNDDGSYRYTKECHVKVGELKRDLDIANSQIGDYKKAIELKDLALTKADARAEVWRETTFKLEDRVSTIDNLMNKNHALYFISGVLFTSLAVWGAGQLSR